MSFEPFFLNFHLLKPYTYHFIFHCVVASVALFQTNIMYLDNATFCFSLGLRELAERGPVG